MRLRIIDAVGDQMDYLCGCTRESIARSLQQTVVGHPTMDPQRDERNACERWGISLPRDVVDTLEIPLRKGCAGWQDGEGVISGAPEAELSWDGVTAPNGALSLDEDSGGIRLVTAADREYDKLMLVFHQLFFLVMGEIEDDVVLVRVVLNDLLKPVRRR